MIKLQIVEKRRKFSEKSATDKIFAEKNSYI